MNGPYVAVAASLPPLVRGRHLLELGPDQVLELGDRLPRLQVPAELIYYRVTTISRGKNISVTKICDVIQYTFPLSVL